LNDLIGAFWARHAPRVTEATADREALIGVAATLFVAGGSGLQPSSRD
jgi:hypothetical protein